MPDAHKAKLQALKKLVDEMIDDIVAGDAPEPEAEEAPEATVEVEAEGLQPEEAETLRQRMAALMNE